MGFELLFPERLKLQSLTGLCRKVPSTDMMALKGKFEVILEKSVSAGLSNKDWNGVSAPRDRLLTVQAMSPQIEIASNLLQYLKEKSIKNLI